MNRTTLLGLGVVVVLLAGFFFFFYTPRGTETTSDTSTTSTPAQITTKTAQEDSAEYSIDVQYPEFGIPVFDAEISKSVHAAVEELKKQAATDKPVANGFRKYELYGRVSGTYLDENIANAKIVLAQDFGGAHPLPIVVTFNFDRKTGTLFTLDSALARLGLTLPQMASEAKAQLDATLGKDIIAPEGADAKAENYQTFIVGVNSVTFIFQPYQVAPYSAGTPEVVFARQ